MAFLGKMFGGGQKKPPPPTSEQTIATLQTTTDLLEKKEAQLQKKIDQEVEKAKVLMAKKTPQAKKEALACMRRKKMLEGQMEGFSRQRANMDAIKMTAEGAEMNAEVLRAQQQAAAHMKAEQARLGIDKADEIRDPMQDEVRDAMDTAQEVSAALAEPLGDLGDEDELLAELDQYMEEQFSADLMGIGATPALPAAPTAAKPQASADEDALAALEADLAMPA
eukprot:TRINITY_DN657_c0_g1_i3.p1 TRINITY_DN657_c0_g1~~TRINITY_DN657_c0_g1_i3.p1  ORF type:complete len:240 (+),score=104.95 TRINITY_DN657_c0_g1_i3:53-721(+)